MTNVVLDGEGRPVSAKCELDDQCTRPFADVAEAAALAATWWPTFDAAGATSRIPIFVDKPGT